MKIKNNIFFVCFLSLIQTTSFAADIFSELTGEAARKRTSEARAARDQANNELNKINNLSKIKSEELAKLQESLQNIVSSRISWMKKMSDSIKQQIEKNQQIENEILTEFDILMKNEKDFRDLLTIFEEFRIAARKINLGAESSIQLAQFIRKSDISLIQWSKAFTKLYEESGDNENLRKNSYALFRHIAKVGTLKGKELVVVEVEKIAMEFLKHVNIVTIEKASLDIKTISQLSQNQRFKIQATLQGLRENRQQLETALQYLEERK